MEKNLGHATAYGYAKSKGYSGTEEEFAELMADYATVGQSAAQSAEQAAASATSASGSATTASQAAQTATDKASEAVTAAGTATTKASEASQSASTASAAATSASTSAQTATTAATTATTKASEASESATTATAAKTDAETARDAAAQSASEAAESARTLTIDDTLTQSGQAADAKVVGDKISDVKEDFNNQLEPNYMVELVKGASANTSGPLMPFRIHAGDSITVTSKDGSNFVNCQFRCYDANKTYVDYWRLYSEHGNKRTFTTSKEAYYVGITTVDAPSPEYYIAVNNSNAYKQVINAIDEGYKAAVVTINNRVDVIAEQSIKAGIINRFNKATITSGYYLSTINGALAAYDSFFASDYIYVADLENIKCSYTHIVCFYDANKAFISGQGFNTNSADNSISRPANAIYMRFSNYLTNLDHSQIGESVDRSNYIPYGKYTLPDLILETNKIIVDASGNGDYTSLTQALYENVDSGIEIEVKPGVYDIVSEYVAIFGQEAVDNMADSDGAIFNGFQYGAIIRSRTITFDSGAYVVCDWTGHTVDGTHRFSALRVDYNCKIIGLNLVSTATFYAIHDDYGLSTPYLVEYEKCYVEGVNLTHANCIGGGCKKYSRHVLKNCYFDNHLTGSATVRYHNTNAEGAEPEIYVSNCYFNNWFTPRWYGAQTSKMKVYVNNCEAKSIHKMQESASFTVDNVDLYKWCNTETNPVT